MAEPRLIHILGASHTGGLQLRMFFSARLSSRQPRRSSLLQLRRRCLLLHTLRRQGYSLTEKQQKSPAAGLDVGLAVIDWMLCRCLVLRLLRKSTLFLKLALKMQG